MFSRFRTLAFASAAASFCQINSVTAEEPQTLEAMNRVITSCLDAKLPAFAPWHAGLQTKTVRTITFQPSMYYDAWRYLKGIEAYTRYPKQQGHSIGIKCSSPDHDCVESMYVYGATKLLNSDGSPAKDLAGIDSFNKTKVHSHVQFTYDRQLFMHGYFSVDNTVWTKKDMPEANANMFASCTTHYNTPKYVECLKDQDDLLLNGVSEVRSRVYPWSMDRLGPSNFVWGGLQSAAYQVDEKGMPTSFFDEDIMQSKELPTIIVENHWSEGRKLSLSFPLVEGRRVNDTDADKKKAAERVQTQWGCFKPLLKQLDAH